MFKYAQKTIVNYGVGSLAEIGSLISRYGKRCLFINNGELFLEPAYKTVRLSLVEHEISFDEFSNIQANPTVENILEGIALTLENDYDVIFGLGGGSVMDSAKAISFLAKESDIDWDNVFATYTSPHADYEDRKNVLPLILTPTTSGTGSEITQAAVLTYGDEKLSIFHQQILAKETLIDPTLMLTLPASVTAHSGFDAFTHAFESYVSLNANPLAQLDALNAMKKIVDTLPNLMNDLHNLELREAMTLASLIAGRALSNSGASIPHPLAEVVGGYTNRPHGAILASLYPSYIQTCQKENEEDFKTISNYVFGNDDLYENVVSFLKEIQLDDSLMDLVEHKETLEKILVHPIMEHLSFADASTLRTIIKNA
ncbi:iron-containing alcohol dehydrogenase [Erysipelothrix rhusiopathiae]|nr:iron-containing alcohol dehydrogenase [Erysipelothrix rhusiopathiae]MDE8055268.1 iron-containing alcohol dehydrogenase [Erysipelothrix rhusiopathiae]MDE8092122.1 iron-containing alcohol dehydrogenase [Erysipelothrix rhusiopathiae]MDE8098129.1 iron-containing alcohol dehydrogenase [Erysipelothrix rhusiopathiae]MDE8103369.1 iron-containing alcohol dehydrogenase [Erysipelothrix rhusiopathiae]